MKACGLIVEYNPFHNGHLYHLQRAKAISGADCMIAVMSGSFLQRGEPALIDKFHRAKAVIQNGVDLVVELPYVFAVESSDLFAKGAVLTLDGLDVDAICFGSEAGEIQDFLAGYERFKNQHDTFETIVKDELKQGHSFPEANRQAYQQIGLQQAAFDLTKPNNILGFSYVKAIMDHHLSIQPLTIKRHKSDYHDQEMDGNIASATSIRKALFKEDTITPDIATTIPPAMKIALEHYRQDTKTWHQWDAYFPLLRYRVLTMHTDELGQIQGVDEGLEFKLKKTAKSVTSFTEWVEVIKSKRYTWTRLQRMFTHILTNTKKHEITACKTRSTMPYIRLLGASETGRAYLKQTRKQRNIPIISNISKSMPEMLQIEERSTDAYYSILPQEQQQNMHKQALQPPFFLS